MGVADSPLRDRVVFIEGAPRSGTTLLTALMSAHPEIAGITGESHLFDRGVGDLFDNHERGRFLAHFIDRAELVDVVRDTCDAILERMRATVRPEARYVLDKTPASRTAPGTPLSRKLEVYPDAWYVHIVRERADVVSSLMRAPWNSDPSEAASGRWWDEAVSAVDDVLGPAGRYRRVTYEDLVADPVAVVGGIFDWLGVPADAGVLDRVALLAREKYSYYGPADAEAEPPARAVHDVDGEPAPAAQAPGLRRRLRRSGPGLLARRLAGRFGNRRREAVANDFLLAFREADPERLRALTSPSVAVTVRSSEGDLRLEGDAARDALADIGRRAFSGRHLSEAWEVIAGRAGVAVLGAAVRHGGTRVDLSCALLVRGGKVVSAGLIFAGPPEGRPLADLAAASA